ncbi:MAG: OsmC family protein [Bacteroidales bacterium]|nr:OsmC family protein [Bacteroidales bacterium]
MAFETKINSHRLIMDASSDFGGQDLGPSPKPFMLVALAGCTGMDVVSLLKKMRVDFDSFSIEVEGELSEDSPSRYTKMHVIYIFKGRELPMNKLEKAVKMSEDQLCGVGAVYRKCMEISSEIRILS